MKIRHAPRLLHVLLILQALLISPSSRAEDWIRVPGSKGPWDIGYVDMDSLKLERPLVTYVRQGATLTGLRSGRSEILKVNCGVRLDPGSSYSREVIFVCREARQRPEWKAGESNESSQSTASQSKALPADDSRPPNATYIAEIVRTIKANILWIDGAVPDASCEVLVKFDEAGNIVSHRIVSSHGHPQWCPTVIRALDRTERIPQDGDGKVPPPSLITFKSKE